MPLKLWGFLKLEFLANINSFFEMKFKFDGVEKYQTKSDFFSRKFERTQDVEMRSRSSSPIKVDDQDPIILAKLSTLIILLKKIKNIRQLRRIRLIQKWVILLWRWYGQRRFRGSDRWEPKPTRSLSKIEAEADHRKAKKLLWCRNICRSHHKRYSWINTKNNL